MTSDAEVKQRLNKTTEINDSGWEQLDISHQKTTEVAPTTKPKSTTMESTINEAYKQGRTNMEISHQKLNELRITIAENKPMTRRECGLLKMAIKKTQK